MSEQTVGPAGDAREVRLLISENNCMPSQVVFQGDLATGMHKFYNPRSGINNIPLITDEKMEIQRG